MKVDFKSVRATAPKLVFQDHLALAFHQSDGPGMRRTKTFIPEVRGSKADRSVFVPVLDPANLSFGSDPEQSACAAVDYVLLLSIDHDGIVRCSGAKLIAQVWIPSVVARS